MTALVTAKGCAVRRGQARLLEPIDLAIGRGEFVLLIGPNGAGKTTLVRALARIEKPTQGRVRRRRGVRVGFVPQHPHRDPFLPLTVGNFLVLSKAGEADERILSTLGIYPLAERPLANLSGGELRRTATARALLRRPGLLLLDEPLAGIDLTSQSPILALLADTVEQQNAGLLLVAHEILAALPFVTRLVMLDRSIVADGPPEEVVRSAEFEERYGPVIAEAALGVLAHRGGGHA